MPLFWERTSIGALRCTICEVNEQQSDPPFLLREAGVVVNDVPKIHVQDPTDKDHAIYFPKRDVTIPLQLWRVFSYFPTYQPTDQQLEDSESVLMLTPEWTWNPHTDAYSQSEEQMLDWEGNIRDP